MIYALIAGAPDLPQEFLRAAPWDKIWDTVLVGVGAVFASAIAWWKSLAPRYQVAVAVVGACMFWFFL